MKKLFARLFAPVYSHQINLPNGQPVNMTSPAAFTVEDVALTLRPVKKFSRFQQIARWIAMALLIIGLGVSLYYNWQQNRWVASLEDDLVNYQDAYQGVQSDYENLSSNYNQLKSDYSQLQYSNQELRDQNDGLQSDRYELLNELDSVAQSIVNVADEAYSVRSDIYTVYSDMYYDNNYPSIDDLEALLGNTDDVYDELDDIESDLETYLFNFGQ